eukprot:COSAG04_NODE_5194_length_1706_cov_1.719975_1_plen_79_part_10
MNINYWVVQNTVRAVSTMTLSTAQRQRQNIGAAHVTLTGRFVRQEAGAAGSSAAAEDLLGASASGYPFLSKVDNEKLWR